MLMQLVCSCASTCWLRLYGMTICLPLSSMPSITTSSSLYGQYGLMLAWSSSLVLGHPAIINFFNCWWWSSCHDACCISAMDMHSGMSIEFCMAFTCMSMSFIGLSLPSTWLFLDSQSTMKISGPGLYIIWTLYWWNFSSMHCICCNSVATSFLNIAISGLWFVMMSTSLPKQ